MDLLLACCFVAKKVAINQFLLKGCVEMAIKKVPSVLAIERDEKGNLSTWCQYCRKFHHHGTGEGHRDAHCIEEDSPYIRTGYILKKMKLGGKEITRKEN
ncbi:hypothetical protein bcere0020_43510 [Bacillus cereus Rock3-29]|nr:hypothetical protein bcere0020_43510 [Bacillus cereus Rock3-29]